eukprot:11172867-Prorocentrum_lima.AAC.1
MRHPKWQRVWLRPSYAKTSSASQLMRKLVSTTKARNKTDAVDEAAIAGVMPQAVCFFRC